MIVGCYSIDVYCDTDERHPKFGTAEWASFALRFPQAFTGETRGQCIRAARRAGWIIGKARQVCPWCAKQTRGKK